MNINKLSYKTKVTATGITEKTTIHKTRSYRKHRKDESAQNKKLHKTRSCKKYIKDEVKTLEVTKQTKLQEKKLQKTHKRRKFLCFFYLLLH